MHVAHDGTHDRSCCPASDKTAICCHFIHMIHPRRTLSAAGSFLLHPLSLFSPYIKRWVALSPHVAICRVESPPDTLAYLSSAAQTSKSARASRRDGKAPPGSRHRLQSTRCSPGMKYPFRYEEQAGRPQAEFNSFICSGDDVFSTDIKYLLSAKHSFRHSFVMLTRG